MSGVAHIGCIITARSRLLSVTESFVLPPLRAEPAMALRRPNYERPCCPKCDMGMIVTGGYDLDPEYKTFECLRCRHVERPAKRAQAAE
jgi:hypothetical protein